MRESTTMAKKPQTRLPSVNSVGSIATARIGFMRLLPSGHDMAAGLNETALLGHDLHSIGGKHQFRAGTKLNHTKFFATRDSLPAVERADDAASEHSGDLLYRKSTRGRIGSLEADPHRLVSLGAFGPHGIEEFAGLVEQFDDSAGERSA